MTEMRDEFVKWCARVPSSDQNWQLMWEAWQAAYGAGYAKAIDFIACGEQDG
jgi:ferric-dicitrate binding protein FerR (iron transport regulator)